MKKHTIYALISLLVIVLTWNMIGIEYTVIRGIAGFVLGWNIVDVISKGI